MFLFFLSLSLKRTPPISQPSTSPPLQFSCPKRKNEIFRFHDENGVLATKLVCRVPRIKVNKNYIFNFPFFSFTLNYCYCYVTLICICNFPFFSWWFFFLAWSRYHFNIVASWPCKGWFVSSRINFFGYHFNIVVKHHHHGNILRQRYWSLFGSVFKHFHWF